MWDEEMSCEQMRWIMVSDVESTLLLIGNINKWMKNEMAENFELYRHHA